MLGLFLTLPGMSVKQPHCLITMADLPTFASKAYSVAFELIQVCVENTHSKDSSKMERFMFATLVRKIYYIERPMDCFSPKMDAKVKMDFFDSVKRETHRNRRLLSWHPGQTENQP